MNQQESTILGLTFRMDGDDRTLLAEFNPVESWHPIDKTEVRRALTAQGLDSLFLDETALEELCEKYNTVTESFTLTIGARKDAEAAITVASDKMTAYLTIFPPRGGRPVDRTLVLDALHRAGVVYGILNAEIDLAVADSRVDARPVARGTAAVHGVNTQFNSLIPEINDRRLKVDTHGTVDYRDLGLFSTVTVGTPLMERIPATQGVSGTDVLGETIPAKPGKDSAFAPTLRGAMVSPENPDILLAAIAGQPLLVARGVKVEPILKVKAVDLSTGNLDFDGSVNIAGDVKSGMKIKVSGDVNIGGVVEAAEIHADGNITIKGGIIGHGEKVQEGSSRHDVARISCGGSISALFVENAHVTAGDRILIGEVAKQSELTATNQVIVGKTGSRKGHIVGGITRATLLIQAHVAGSPTGVRTEMEIGLNPLLHSKMIAIEKQLQRFNKEQEELARIIAYAQDNPQRVNPDVLHKIECTNEKLDMDIETCNQEQIALQSKLKLSGTAKVAIGQKVFGGVDVRIGHKTWQVNDDRNGGTFRMQDGEVIFENA